MFIFSDAPNVSSNNITGCNMTDNNTRQDMVESESKKYVLQPSKKSFST